MRKYRRAIPRPRNVCAVTSITAAAMAIGLLSPGAASADAFVALPPGHIDSHGIRISSTGEHAVVSPSLAANGAGRVAWVSGDVTAEIDTPPGAVGPNNGAQNNPGTNDSSTHGSSGLTVGYIVGCQVQLLNTPVGATLAFDNAIPTIGGNATIPIAPGQVKWVQINNIDMTKSGTYHISYQDVSMNIENCGGFAQARQFSVVEIIGPDYGKTTLYGQPFSIG
ncbi:MspA family porin [Nocardia albiluteola]|nr:MspA family porin [Nocardia albiluteola]